MHAPCGHRLTQSTSDEMDGWYEVEEDLICHACAELERHQEQNKDGAEPGVIPRVVDRRPTSD